MPFPPSVLDRPRPASRSARVIRALRTQLPPLARLAGPVILAEIGWMAMSIVDTVMVAPLGPAALGGVGVGGSLFFAFGIFGLGLLLGLDTVIAQAHGAGQPVACREWAWQGLWLALAAAVPIFLIVLLIQANVDLLGFHPDVRPVIEGYVAIVGWSIWPLLLYGVARRYLQALAHVRAVMLALITANVVNAVANWMLIHGRWGAPALGTDGAAWATLLSRIYMAAVLVVAAVWHDRRMPAPIWRVRKLPVAAKLKRLAGLGLPAAAQVTLEVGSFATTSALAARLAPVSLAAHHVALTLASTTFMLPLGLSSAAAVRVGHAVGARSGREASHAGWTALASAVGLMLMSACVFVGAPRWLLGLFTADQEVIAAGVWLLAVAAMFQIFDGLQVTATGVLRGVGDTRTPLMWNLVGHWAIGLPVGSALCFAAGWDVIGLWVGLSIGLTIVGLMLVRAWARAERQVRSSLRE
ncbi:MAG TPA: MATE family efflux transporter [Vicinamibacterales bacterium]